MKGEPTHEQVDALMAMYASEGYEIPPQPSSLAYKPYRPRMNPIQGKCFDAIKAHLYSLLHGPRYCIDDQSIVYTAGGLRRMSALRPGTEPGFLPLEIEVVSWGGKSLVAGKTSHFFNEPNSEALRLWFKNGNYLDCSLEHPLWCVVGDDVGFKKAAEISASNLPVY